MTKHLVGGIILLDCTVIWLQMVDNTGVLLVARQLKETFTDVTPCFFLIYATFKYKKNVRSSCELCWEGENLFISITVSLFELYG